VGGFGSGRYSTSFHNTWGYRRLTLKGTTKRVGIAGRRIRLGPKYPDTTIETSAGIFEIQWSSCHFGGHRPWWTCKECKRRVGTLYAPTGSLRGGGRGDWRCRHCHRIEYDTQYHSPESNAIGRAWRAAEKLGVDSLFLPAAAVRRPKYMRRKKFEELLAEYTEAQAHMNRTLNAWIDRQGEKIDQLDARLSK
jgi:hypothetical protein